MINIGCHLSIAKGFEAAAKDCVRIGANTLQFFTRNPRGGKVKSLDLEDINKFIALSRENGFSSIVAHAPYTLNVCSARDDVAEFSCGMMVQDLERMENIPGNFYNFHPGSHTGQGIEIGIDKIARALNRILREDMNTTVLLETMSGKGSEVGGKFGEIREIIDRVEIKSKIGVCLDTCHISDAGYDIANNLDGVIREFDSVIGLKYIKAVHLNDSKNPVGSRKDRHEKIGKGVLGVDLFEKIINRKEFKNLPFILETPQPDLDGYKSEIELLRSLEH